MSLYTVRNLIKELKSYCKFREEIFPPENGLAFVNGWLDLESFEFSEHKVERFVHSYLDIIYNQSAQVSESIKQLFSFWVSGDFHFLNHLRGFLPRLLLRPLWFRSALFISGPPRTGKSTFVNLCQEISGDAFVTIGEGHRSFDRALWESARVIVYNDCSSLDRKNRDIIRQLTGSDLISYEKKYVQISSDQYFRFRGVLMVVSNYSKGEIVSNSGDIALAKRFFEIPFTNIPRPEDINPQMLIHLKDSIPSIVNWALHVDPEVMQIQTGALNLDGNLRV